MPLDARTVHLRVPVPAASIPALLATIFRSVAETDRVVEEPVSEEAKVATGFEKSPFSLSIRTSYPT